MAWIINDCIILIFLLSLCYCYLKQRRDGLVLLSIVGYCCMPVLRIGETGFNSAYCITAILVCFAIIELVKTGWKLQKLQLLYGAFMVGAIFVTTLGWLLNGEPKGADIFTFSDWRNTYSVFSVSAFSSKRYRMIRSGGGLWCMGLAL